MARILPEPGQAGATAAPDGVARPLRILLGAEGAERAVLAGQLAGESRLVESHGWLEQVAPAALRRGPFDAIVLAGGAAPDGAMAALRDIRRQGLGVPVLLLAPRQDADEAFEQGADEVVAAPAIPAVILARLHAMVRRIAGHAGAPLVCGNVALDRARQSVAVDGRPVAVTTREFEVLEALLSRRSALLSKERFMNRLYGEAEGPDQRIIDVFICKLRRKLAAAGAAEIVRTVWGLGYMAEDPGPAAVFAARARHAASHGPGDAGLDLAGA
ncbi:response regulator transcription factor [Falsiroseomonas selenitidurans]|uniref:Response regulator transcription factor n=1 Tax=Falsiroseomonas selenitidurans TaxID=2716335 RepID=A0ABX1E0Y1_9PROT|nr:response regulator transcription factor [Falsiroseomonas selenitidurans]NKC29483.1 response regulator transcription factor [Falsiroseomonas selenitidurans]